MTHHKPTQEPLCITGLWVVTHDKELIVAVEVDGEWKKVYSGYYPVGESLISHIVEPLGMRNGKPLEWLKP